MSKPDVPPDIDQIGSRIAGEFLAFNVSCNRIYTLVTDAIMAERAAQRERDAVIVIELSKPLAIATDQQLQTALFKSLDRAVEARGEVIASAIRSGA